SPVRSATTTKALSKDDAFFVSIENKNSFKIQIKSGFQKIRAVVHITAINYFFSLLRRKNLLYQGRNCRS
ncbi:hypothetical protein, partial [Aliivibrio fischeri]|uniref:hypothetical protein n=1 Tax=Aliivibrio fischeri TaxID=668 RepID=UPI001BDF5E6D